ncbi:hypothetical protein [Alkalihalobacterium alkalinitrilicum]|uniref:hypothetical protein n=1 Tax=Alkalihalobacterium alkalinitrilicum TaxID=427920 RepID=UPI0009949A83|nr:hypothetical protein [Alkalihalobacterium alkalinitrilicum]
MDQELRKHLEQLAAAKGLTLKELIDEVQKLQVESIHFTFSADFINLQKVYPALIFHEFHRLNELIEENQLYGVFLQIKDVFEVIAKYPVLYYVSLLKQQKSKLNDEQQQLMHDILSQVLSLGHWETALKKITNIFKNQDAKSSEHEAIETIAQTVGKIYKEHKIVKWRNDYIGHGALGNAEKEDFKEKLHKYLSILENFFLQKNIQQAFQQLKYVLQQNGVGIQLAKKQVLEKAYLEKEADHLLLFDSFYSNKKLIGYLDYSNGQKYYRSHKHIEKDYRKFVQSNHQSSVLDSSQHIPLDFISEAYEQQLLTELKEDFVKPEYLFNWLEHLLHNDVSFTKHLIMEEGMGKTTFIHAIDERKMNKVPKSEGFSQTTIRTIYFNSFIQDIESYFKNTLFDVLTSMKVQGAEHKIPLYPIADHFRNQPTEKNLLALLDFYRKIYAEYTDKEQLLIILDGLDELSPDQLQWVQKLLPIKQAVSDHLSILVTSRPTVTLEKPYDRYVVTREHLDNIELLEKYLKKQTNKDEQIIRTQLLPVTEYRFLYTRPIVLVQKFNQDQLTTYNEVVDEFLKMLHELYTDKHCYILYQVFALLAVAPKALTLEQISYLLTLESPTFKVLGLMRDVKCWLTSYWENDAYVYEIRHQSIKQQFLQNDQIQSALDMLQNMWDAIAIKPVEQQLTEKEMLLFLLCKETTKQKAEYIQNIHSIIKRTYPYVESKREMDILILLMRGALPYEKKERVELLDYYLMEMHIVKGEQQSVYQDIKKGAYLPVITSSNYEAIGRTLILDMIMGTLFPNEYVYDKERNLDRAILVKPFIDQKNKQHIIGLNMAGSRMIDWKNFTKEWAKYPEHRYLMVQAIDSRINKCFKDMDWDEGEKIYEHFLKIVNHHYPIPILAASYEVHLTHLKMLFKRYDLKHGISEMRFNLPFFDIGDNEYSNIYEQESIALYTKIVEAVTNLTELQAKLFALNHQKVTTDHALTLSFVLTQSIERNMSGEVLYHLFEICNSYLRWIHHSEIEKTPDQTTLLDIMEKTYTPVKDTEVNYTKELYEKVVEHIPTLDENTDLNDLLENILTLEDEQLKSQLLYQGLRIKYLLVRNGAQPIGNRWHEYLSYLVESTNLKHYSDLEKGILQFIYAYAIYERMMNDSMDEATFGPLYQKHLDVLTKAIEMLQSSEPTNDMDVLLKKLAMLFTYEQANLEANVYQTGHRIVQHQSLFNVEN